MNLVHNGQKGDLWGCWGSARAFLPLHCDPFQVRGRQVGKSLSPSLLSACAWNSIVHPLAFLSSVLQITAGVGRDVCRES